MSKDRPIVYESYAEHLQARIRELEAALQASDEWAESLPEVIGYCDLPHKLGDTTPDGKALYQIAHEQNEGCVNWKSLQVHHRNACDRIAKAKAVLEQLLSITSWDGYRTAELEIRRAVGALEGK